MALVELISAIFINAKQPIIGSYEQIPTYWDIITDQQKTFHQVLFGNGDTLTSQPISPRNIDTAYPWCTWHPVNRIHREKYACFDVLYKFNSYGTRGSLPEPTDTNCILFLGDSFAEGYGLAEDSTIEERLHKTLQRPVLNLGTSGHFGSTQMSLVYESFAKKFRHKEVCVLLFLENDFMENDVQSHYKNFPHRYRPYRVLTENDSSKIVYRGSIDSTLFSWQHFNAIFKTVIPIFPPNETFISKLSKLTYTRRLLHLLTSNAKKNSASNIVPPELDASPNDLAILELDMDAIVREANMHGANVTFINLPSKYLMTCTKKSDTIAEKYLKLEQQLTQLAEKKNAHYLSFYNYLIKNKVGEQSLFFPCDGHYSNSGEAHLSQFLYSYYLKR